MFMCYIFFIWKLLGEIEYVFFFPLMRGEQFCGCLAWLMYNFRSEVFSDVPKALEEELFISIIHQKVNVRTYIEEMNTIMSSGFKF